MGVDRGPLIDAARTLVHPADGPVVDDRILTSAARVRAVADLGLLDTGDEDLFDRWALRATELTFDGNQEAQDILAAADAEMYAAKRNA